MIAQEGFSALKSLFLKVDHVVRATLLYLVITTHKTLSNSEMENLIKIATIEVTRACVTKKEGLCHALKIITHSHPTLAHDPLLISNSASALYK